MTAPAPLPSVALAPAGAHSEDFRLPAVAGLDLPYPALLHVLAALRAAALSQVLDGLSDPAIPPSSQRVLSRRSARACFAAEYRRGEAQPLWLRTENDPLRLMDSVDASLPG